MSLEWGDLADCSSQNDNSAGQEGGHDVGPTDPDQGVVESDIPDGSGFSSLAVSSMSIKDTDEGAEPGLVKTHT